MPGEQVWDQYNVHKLLGYRLEDCRPGVSIYVEDDHRVLAHVPPTAAEYAAFVGCATAFEDSGLEYIPDSDLVPRIQEQAERKRRCSDYVDFLAYDQNGLPQCWSDGTVQAADVTRRIQGLPSVRLSASSLAVPINGGHSGGSEYNAVRMAMQDGIVRQDLWGNNDTHNYSNQPGIKEDRTNHKILGFIDCGSNERKWNACLLNTLCGPFAYNRMSHVMAMMERVIIEAGSLGWRVRNSWKDSWGVKNWRGVGGFQTFRWCPDSGGCITGMTQSIK